ncbi:MAG: winged helix-turn-helix domain-containing protein [Cellvibrionaceae bacterium]
MNKVEFFQFSYLLNEAKLSHQGQAIEMRNKLHQMLAYFLRHPNQIITKEKLLDTIWSHGEYREKSLSQSLLELRKILGDSATNPKFIRTIPNEGYIWIAPIAEAEKVQGHSKHPYVVGSLLSIIFLATVITFFWPTQHRFSFNEQDKLVIGILPFKNNTAQIRYKWVEYGLSDMLATDLIQFDGIEVINPSELSNEFRLKNTQKIIKDEGLDILLIAQFNQSGNHQNLNYTLIAADKSQVLGKFQSQDLAFSMPNLASEIHRKIRPNSQASLSQYTWQVNAMHEYAKGQHAMVKQGCKLAQHYFAAAFIIDPTHYWSQLQLIFCQLEFNQNQIASENLEALLNINIDESFTSLAALASAQLAVNQGNVIKAREALTKSDYLTKLANNAQWLELGRKIEQNTNKKNNL